MNSFRKKNNFLIIIFLTCGSLLAQNQVKIDSLTRVLENEIIEEKKVDIYNLLAEKHTQIGSVQAYNFANKALSLSKQINYNKGIIDAYFWIGWTATETGNYRKANDSYIRVLDLAKKTRYIGGESNAYNGLGTLNNYQGNNSQAIKFYTKSLELKEKLNDKKGIGNLYSNIGVIHKKKGEYSNALEYYFKAVIIAKEIGDKKGLAKRYGNIGLTYVKQGNYSMALDYNFKAIEIFKILGNKKNEAFVYNNIGMIYYNQGNYPLALKSFFKSLNIKEELGDKRAMISSISNIGSVYKTQRNHSKALEYYYKCLAIDEEIGDNIGVADDYLNIGNISYDRGDYNKALENSFKSLKISEQFDLKSIIVSNLLTIGNIYSAQRKYTKALKHLQKGLLLSLKNGEQSQYAIISNSIGKVQWELGNYKKAKKNLSKGIQLAEKINFPTEIKNGSETLSKVYKTLGNYQAALESYELYHSVYNSLLGKEKIKQISQLQIQYETEKKEQEIKNLSQEASIQSLKLKESNLKQTIFGIAIAILLLLTFVFYLINRQRQLILKQKAQSIEQNLLRVQMNPHFIFNAMTSIQDYVNQGAIKQASIYLVKFSKLIRQVLDDSRSEFISLNQEIIMLDNYLVLQNLRREYPFTYTIETEENLINEEIAIPPMFAQPFVENAIEHGIVSMKENASIHIYFSLKNDYLVLRVTDNGSGIKKSTKIKNDNHISHAVKITEERIALYRQMGNKKIAFDIQNISSGTQVTFNLPFQYL